MPINAGSFDSRITLGSNHGGLGAALEAGRQDKRRSKLFDFAVEDRDREIKRQEASPTHWRRQQETQVSETSRRG